MIGFEQAQEILCREADKLPPEIFRGLNGGIVLLPDTKLHPQNKNNDLYILGQYFYEPLGMGRYIAIYYGSFCRAHGRLSEEEQAEKLTAVLRHELTHHLEHLAGDRSLEICDAQQIGEYLQKAREDKRKAW